MVETDFERILDLCTVDRDQKYFSNEGSAEISDEAVF